jgi:hypothetical protein
VSGCCWQYLLITKDADLPKRSPTIAEKRISIVNLLGSSTGTLMEGGVILVVLQGVLFNLHSELGNVSEFKMILMLID